jgi:pimeloyl-ACP methyl ester carboxylesterase
MGPSNDIQTKAAPDEANRDYIGRLNQLEQRYEVDAHGLAICWRRFGAGRPLILLHGGHGSWMHWIRNLEALGKRYSVWVPDLPGYGDSDMPLGTSLDAVLAPMLTSLDAVIGDTDDFDLVGFSFGGLVAAHMAARCPRVRRLALIGPAGHGGVRRARGQLRNWSQAHLAGDTQALTETMQHNLWVHMLHHSSSIDALATVVHTQSCVQTRFRSKALSRTAGLPLALTEFSGELLLAWGEHDVTAVPYEVAAALSAGRSACRTSIVPNAGHWLQYEQPAIFNSLLLDWLDKKYVGEVK